MPGKLSAVPGATGRERSLDAVPKGEPGASGEAGESSRLGTQQRCVPILNDFSFRTRQTELQFLPNGMQPRDTSGMSDFYEMEVGQFAVAAPSHHSH